MKTFSCPGYKGHKCEKVVKCAWNRVRCTSCRKGYELLFKKEYYKKNKEELQKQHRRYYRKNRAHLIKKVDELRKKHPIRKLLNSHLDYILNPSTNSHKSYKGMPFFDAWNPKKGGSYIAGETWIKENIGDRPTDGKYQLHVIDRRKGVIPGNLVWIPVGAHKREEMLNKVLLENQQLRQRLKKYKEKS